MALQCQMCVAALEEYIIAGELAGRSSRTVEGYRRYLPRFLEILHGLGACLGDADQGTVRRAVHELVQGFASSSAVTVNAIVRAFLNWCLREGVRQAPVSLPSPRAEEKVIRALSPEEVARLLSACSNDRYGIRDRAIILVLYDTGLRASELLSLRVDPSGRYETIAVMGKGGRERVVRLGARARQALLRYVRTWRPEGRLWKGRKGDLGHKGLDDILRRVGAKAGIKAYPHLLRHSFASRMLALSGDVLAVKALGGWRSDAVLVRYVRSREIERALEVHRKFSPADSL